jgi:hypothetical protein
LSTTILATETSANALEKTLIVHFKHEPLLLLLLLLHIGRSFLGGSLGIGTAEGEAACRGKMEEDDITSDLGDDHGWMHFDRWMSSLNIGKQ